MKFFCKVLNSSRFKSPRTFTYEQKQYVVREITDRWYEGGTKPEAPIVSYFKVRADDGGQYIIRYDSFHDEWTLVVPPPTVK